MNRVTIVALIIAITFSVGLRGATSDDYDPLDEANPEDFMDTVKPGDTVVIPKNPERVLPPPVVLTTPPVTSAQPIMPAKPAVPVPAQPPPKTPSPPRPKPAVTVLPPVPVQPYMPPNARNINLGVYLENDKETARRIGKAALVRGKKFIVEARAMIPDINKACKEVLFTLESKAGSSYFEYNDVLVGYEWRSPWVYDAGKRAHSAKVTVNASAVTMMRQMDQISAVCSGLSDGRLEFEIIPGR